MLKDGGAQVDRLHQVARPLAEIRILLRRKPLNLATRIRWHKVEKRLLAPGEKSIGFILNRRVPTRPQLSKCVIALVEQRGQRAEGVARQHLEDDDGKADHDGKRHDGVDDAGHGVDHQPVAVAHLGKCVVIRTPRRSVEAPPERRVFCQAKEESGICTCATMMRRHVRRYTQPACAATSRKWSSSARSSSSAHAGAQVYIQ